MTFSALLPLLLISQVKIHEIPAELIKNADGVILNQTETINVFNKEKIEGSYELNYIVLTKNKAEINNIVIPYDKYTKIKKVEILLQDENGKKLKKIKRKDFLDIGNTEFIDDSRALIYNIYSNKLPLYVTLKYEYTQKQSFYISAFRPIIDKNFSILHSKFTINNFDPQNKIIFPGHYWKEADVQKMPDHVSYLFDIQPQPASFLKDLDIKNKLYAIRPVLQAFEMDDFEGEMTSWGDFGMWISKLNEGMDTLDEKSRNEILAITQSENDEKIKIQKLYEYLQEQMRYVSIQLGIGGFRPFPAQYVHDNKFGDCKALSNYMKTILDVAGVKSYYTLIQAGDDKYNLINEIPQKCI